MTIQRSGVALALVLVLLIPAEVLAQKRGSGRSSSRSSSSRSSSSRSSSSSSASRGTTSSRSKPSSGGLFGGSKPSTGSSSSSSKPATGRSSSSSKTPPASGAGGGLFGGSGTGSSGTSRPASSSARPPATPGTGPGAGNGSSVKPPSAALSSKAAAQQKAESKRAYLATQRATAPPRSEARVNGATVPIDPRSNLVSNVRSRPSSYIQPETRRSRISEHVVVHHYVHPYSYYASRPVSYGIGPYSPVFWWMMGEWSAERRARWLYHHQANISTQAYADAARDAEVQQRLAALEQQHTPRDPDYVDPEFRSDPTDMYDQAYVEAAYNPVLADAPIVASSSAAPAPASRSSGSLMTGLLSAIALLAACSGLAFGAYWLLFVVRWGK